MSSNFGYLDLILLAMLAGFIILRLRNILGRKTGHQKKPTKSVKNPGIISNNAAKANAAPDIIS